jgi:hypothetical protein
MVSFSAFARRLPAQLWHCLRGRAPAYDAAALPTSRTTFLDATKPPKVHVSSFGQLLLGMRSGEPVLAIFGNAGAVTVQTNSPSPLFVRACVMIRIPRPLLILGRLFYMIYDEDIYWSLLRYEFESELISQSLTKC